VSFQARILAAVIILISVTGCSVTLQKSIRDLGFRPVALPSTAYKPGKVEDTVKADPYQGNTVCDYGTYIGSPVITPDQAASLKATQTLKGSFSLSADYLKQITASLGYTYVKDVSVTLSNVFVDSVSDDKVFSGLSQQSQGCTLAIANSVGRGSLGFLQTALRADATYTVAFDQNVSVSADAQAAALKGLAVQLGATVNSSAAQTLSGTGLYWGVKTPRTDLVKTPTDASPTSPKGFEIVQRVTSDQYYDVGCNATNSGSYAATITLSPGEEILAAVASITASTNLKEQHAQVSSIAGNTVLVSYRIVGLNKDWIGNCPGGGNAHIMVTATVRRPRL
jgi:hypothetical protein